MCSGREKRQKCRNYSILSSGSEFRVLNCAYKERNLLLRAEIACQPNVFLLKIYLRLFLSSFRFEGDLAKDFRMSLQQYSNALQCNYVSLLFVQCTAATLTRAHRSMCQFRAMPATLSTPSLSLSCLPACLLPAVQANKRSCNISSSHNNFSIPVLSSHIANDK